jgi:hypothetical protein
MTHVHTPLGRPTDEALWHSVATTLRDVVLPDVDDPHTRQVVIQLVGVACYARDRGLDPTAERLAELADVLDALAADGSQLVVGSWPVGGRRDAAAILNACASILAACVDESDPAASDVRDRLRPVLVRHLEEDLAGEAVMLEAFRGRLPSE